MNASIDQSAQQWNTIEKVLFKFFFIFFSIFILVENNGAYPFFRLVYWAVESTMHVFIPWIGKNILGLSVPITIFTNGSGDTTYDYVLVLFALVTAFSGSIVWTALDKNKKSYPTIYYWLTVAIRFYVGFMLINYGFSKIIKLQFPYPSLSRLVEPYGSSSPMALAWTFLGFSQGYNLFMGVAEVLAVLLLFRRTMTAGAIITLMTASNVMAVNYFYDVPVKIISTSLVVMCLFLLSRDVPRLFRFFFTGQAVSLPVITRPESKRKWLRTSLRVGKILLVIYVMIGYPISTLDAYNRSRYPGDGPKPPLYGAYRVERFVLGEHKMISPSEDTTVWRQIIVGLFERAQVKFINDSTGNYVFSPDTVNHKITMFPDAGTGSTYQFKYHFTDADHMLWTGKVRDDSVFIEFEKRDFPQFLLMNRGFRWVNEVPFNK